MKYNRYTLQLSEQSKLIYIKKAFKEIGFADEEPYPPEFESDITGLTISISSAPFYGALPPDMDMSYEVLFAFE